MASVSGLGEDRQGSAIHDICDLQHLNSVDFVLPENQLGWSRMMTWRPPQLHAAVRLEEHDSLSAVPSPKWVRGRCNSQTFLHQKHAIGQPSTHLHCKQ